MSADETPARAPHLVTIRHLGSEPTPMGVVELTMTNSPKRNSLSGPMISAISEALTAAESAGCRAFILRAEPGASTWSAGYDVEALPVDGSDPLAWTNPLEGLLRQVRQVPFPVIAAVEGGAWGGACDLAMTCDLVVATQSAVFAITPARLGVPYNTAGTTHFVSALPLHIVKEMFFTARPVTSADAYRWGAVNRLVENAEELAETAAELAAHIASLAPLAIAAIKAEIASITGANPVGSDEWEHLTALRRAAWRSEDYREGLKAFTERRTPLFRGR